jgi:hypothetical protein
MATSQSRGPHGLGAGGLRAKADTPAYHGASPTGRRWTVVPARRPKTGALEILIEGTTEDDTELLLLLELLGDSQPWDDLLPTLRHSVSPAGSERTDPATSSLVARLRALPAASSWRICPASLLLASSACGVDGSSTCESACEIWHRP